MSQNIKFKTITRFFALLLIAIGLIWLLYVHLHAEGYHLIRLSRFYSILVHSVCFGVILLGLLFFLKHMNEMIQVWIISIGFMLSVYVLIEITYYTYLGFKTQENAHVFNCVCAKFDPIMGFTWKTDTTIRVTKIANESLVFDNQFGTNNMGFVSNTSYEKEKENNIFRYIVFGDSFTSGQFLNTNWVDRIQMKKKDLPDSTNLEFYSFGIDGGGITNWYNIYFNYIIKEFDFDGIIIAPWRDNLERDFSILHMSDRGAYFGRYAYSERPKNNREFEKSFSKRMVLTYDVQNASDIDQLINTENQDRKKSLIHFTFKPIDLYFFKYLGQSTVRAYVKLKKTFGDQDTNTINNQTISESFGTERINFLYRMISHAQKNNKIVHLVPMPEREWTFKDESPFYTEALKHIANEHHTGFFNIYPYFQKPDKSSKEAYWLPSDVHWSQRGSDLFAKEFYKYLLDFHHELKRSKKQDLD